MSVTPEKILQVFADLLVEEACRQHRSPNIGLWMEPEMPGLLEPALDAPPEFLIRRIVDIRSKGRDQAYSLLDFGCGDAPHRKALERFGFKWHGLDRRGSADPAALARGGKPIEGDVTLYDGFVLSFMDNCFGVVWSFQSFEHVPDAEVSMKECARVLTNGGLFAGSVSFLEPFHAQSTFCYTPFGFHKLCERHGLRTLKIFPRNDGVSLALRTFMAQLGVGIDWYGVMGGGGIFAKALKDAAERHGNIDGLADAIGAIAGQFLFIAQKSYTQ